MRTHRPRGRHRGDGHYGGPAAHAAIYTKYRRLVQSIRARKPDLAVLIDFPDVNFRLAKELKRSGIPVLYFVSPQLWAWKTISGAMGARAGKQDARDLSV